MKKILIIIFVIWLAVIQNVAPTMVLAEEMASSAATTETGDAYATSESLAITNTTTINSEVEVVQGDLINPEPNLTLFSPQIATGTAEASSSGNSSLTVENQVVATVAAETKVETGGNIQETTGSAVMTTGEAVATAYSTSIDNTTLVDSTMEVALITLLTEWDGNIILQPLTSQEKENLAFTIGNLYISNSGEVVTTAQAETNTGNDTQIAGSEATLTTGSSMTSASATSLVNTTLVDAILFDFFVHNLSLWSGQVFNWESPGSRQNPEQVVGRHLISTQEQDCGECQMDGTINNAASATTNASAYAGTGGNMQIAGGEAIMSTGNAYASAKATSIVNTTLINSAYRLIDLTLFAPWTGNLIFAYPDLVVSIETPPMVRRGDSFIYTVTVKNNGYGEDGDVVLKIGDETKNLGNLAPFETNSQTYTLTTSGVTEPTISVEAVVGGAREEESLANNTARAEVAIIDGSEADSSKTESGDVSHEIPILSIAASNNITTFIYPGDAARYEAVIVNNGPGTAYDNIFHNAFMDKEKKVVGMIQANIGHLEQGARRVIRFNLSTSSSLPAGDYQTVTWVTGRSDDRTELSSNEVVSLVPIRGRFIMTANAISQATTISELSSNEAVLGTKVEGCKNCRWASLILIMTTMLSAFYTYEGRRLRSKRLLTMSLGWGVLGYISLLLVNPECSNGFMLISGSFLCRYFLPIVIAEALLLRALTSQKTPIGIGVKFALTRKMSRQ